MAGKNKERIKDTLDKGPADETRSDVKRFGDSRRRLPLAALFVLLALIGVGVYFAWPSIRVSVEPTPPEDATASSEPEPEPEPEPATTAPVEPFAALVALGEKVAALENAIAGQWVAIERTETDLATARTSSPESNLTLVADTLARLEDLEERLRITESVAQEARGGAANSAEDVSASAIDFQTHERLDAVERTLSTIETGDSTKEINALRAELANLGEQIVTLRQSAEIKQLRDAKNARTMIMLLAYTRLSRATAGAAPFVREAEAFVIAAQANNASGIAFDNAMEKLTAHALAGVPTHAELATRFDDMAIAVVKADVDADDQGWVDATIGRLRRIVTVRRVGGEIAAESLEGRLNALHQALSRGDLADAVTLVDALPDKSRRGAEDWLRDARARLAVEQALAAIEAEVTERVAARWSPTARTEE